jgi:N-acetylglucosaminyldiphosphoundecaprenol N-acetyl-beta-D-mannosaminyltransferase
MDSIDTISVFGLRVFNRGAAEIPIEGPPRTIQTISPNSYGMSTKDPAFRTALREADYLILDGVYFGLAGILLRGSTIRINNGPTMFGTLLRRLGERGGKVFFLGSKEETLRKMAARVGREHPKVEVAWHSPPFKPVFSDEDNAAMIDAINRFEPDVVFVGMTAPKQEKWAHQHRDRLRARLIVSVGAAFDWYAGNEREIAPIWWKLHLGWLVRTIHRPEILKRYPNIGIFFWHLLLASLRIKRFDS